MELKKHLEQLERNQGPIFTTSTGSPISPRNFIRHFKQALKSAGLPDIKVHDRRPSHASLLLASAVNPKLVQERLGHASITLILATYSHVIPRLQEEVARRMDDLMSYYTLSIPYTINPYGLNGLDGKNRVRFLYLMD